MWPRQPQPGAGAAPADRELGAGTAPLAASQPTAAAVSTASTEMGEHVGED